MKRIFILLCVLCVAWVQGQSEEGDHCTTPTGQSGKCAKVSECIPVLNNINRRIISHAVCGYDGNIQIVCCPSPQPLTARTNQPITTRISARKCDEYNEFSYDKFNISNMAGPPVERKVSNCAFQLEPLIVGGMDAKLREFPHMALIGFEYNNSIHWDCGGTLISEQYVLSAAHCVGTRENFKGKAKHVRLGEYDQSTVDDGTTIDLRIIRRISHPNYQPPKYYNDIALFKLRRRIILSGAIRPACLPQVSAVSTKYAIASGWGTVNSKGKQSNVLLKVVLDMFSQNECNSRTVINRKLNEGILEETQVCAGSHTEKRDSCQGDSGGPLQIYHATHACSYTVVGITSVGKACGTIGTPGIYTRVYAYLNWIEKIVWPNQ